MNRIGKVVGGQVYIHVEVLDSLEAKKQSLVRLAESAAQVTANEQYNVVRVALDGTGVALLNYPTFFEEAFPALAGSWKYYPDTKDVRFRDYSRSLNPPILHRKELLISELHPRLREFKTLTQSAEQLGLFSDSTRIGFASYWHKSIRDLGYEIVGHTLRPTDRINPPQGDSHSGSAPKIERHRTALYRTALSAPMQLAIRHGLLTPDYSFFDYGCGRGADVQGLTELGYAALGWDPHYRPEQELVPSDVVNLGFVINVIEDYDERVAALQRAFLLSKKCLIVSAMLAGNAPRVAKSFRDGVVSSRGTFQKYYEQAELAHFIEAALDKDALALAPGVFAVFSSSLEEQRYLLGRYGGERRARGDAALFWRRDSVPRTVSSARPVAYNLSEDDLSALSRLWAIARDLGRMPEEDEVEDPEDLRARFKSFSAAVRLAIARNDAEEFDRQGRSRKNDILVLLALQFFSRRRRFRSFEERIQRDIKFHFGSLIGAEAAAKELLFSVGNTDLITEACVRASEAGLGWLEDGKSLQFHTSMVNRLPAILKVYLGCATTLFGDTSEMDIVKLHIQSGKVTLMKFDQFEGSPIPRMTERVKVRLREQDIDIFRYEGNFPPPLLFRKSRYINEEFPRYAEQFAFDEALEEHKFLDFEGYGPPETEFLAELSRARWQIEGFSLRRSSTAPSLDDRCGRWMTYRDLIECGDTWSRLKLDNSPKQISSFDALVDLTRFVLDPVIDYFGAIRLTYGFCSSELRRHIKAGVAPNLDQHASCETLRTGKNVCNRHGAAVDFLIQDENMREVAEWIRDNLPFDRLYYYGPHRPIHVSYGPDHKRELVTIREVKGRRVPRVESST